MKNSKLKNKTVFISRFLLVPYIFIVLWITLISREPTYRRHKIYTPFWEYQRLLIGNTKFFWQIFFNILMLIPFGILIPFAFRKIKSIKKITLAGFVFSFFIEITQYITARGLFEIDDLFNNTLGALIGYYIYCLLNFIFFKR